ncbi:GCN5 family acetyltransferase [Pokkaliibacter plantistimulans]|uniref:GCN5 family acetyltransferase n=1 Tax=Pokkaliibacter plantistimulans TaxID=1635171 RepID=A0ABX5LY13_9GAMM|nr:GNAT family N-acetyltransferase [Pokkaliibacter plantistimulans]PXF30530.1 GCN5 family acetyltransferase [Pokkaliibacter plantistimulans]
MEVNIRHADKADVDAVRVIYSQPHAYENTLQLPYPSQESWEARFDQVGTHYHNLIAEVGDDVVGQLSLISNNRPRRRHVAEFGMAVRQDYLGKGVGSALLRAALDMCDRWLNIERVEIEVYTDNAAAIALYKKFGFEIEGEHKLYAFKNGHYADVFTMARFRPLMKS